MRYEIVEVEQECGEVEYQVSDVHPNGDRTHSYDFITLAEAEECVNELNEINKNNFNNNRGKIMNIFTKVSLIVAILIGSFFIMNTAEANNPCGGTPCKNIDDIREEQGLAPNDYGRTPATEEVKGVSASEKARIQAEVEALHKKHRESGVEDLDKIFDWDLTSTEAERDAGRCFKKTWYGKKEITCPAN